MRIQATDQGLNAVYLFIAEIIGCKDCTPESKADFGKQCYENRQLLDLNLDTQEGRDDLYENIWLERFYDQIDEYLDNKLMRALDPTIEPFAWSVPLELDASASVLGFMGALLGDFRLLTMTNCILNAGKLSDPWHINDLTRKQVKIVTMRRVYGSTMTIQQIGKDQNVTYSVQDERVLAEELRNGALGLANDFKDFIITNVKPTESMRVRIWDDEFDISCNRFRRVGETTCKYDIFDTQTKRIRRISHTKTKAVADLERFRRYFVTLLIHNLDSQVASRVAYKVMEKYGWCIDIHDAFIVSPEAAMDVRNWYAEEVTAIYNNRNQILQDYFQSIGVGAEALTEWEALQSKVVPVQEPFVCSPMVLK